MPLSERSPRVRRLPAIHMEVEMQPLIGNPWRPADVDKCRRAVAPRKVQASLARHRQGPRGACRRFPAPARRLLVLDDAGVVKMDAMAWIEPRESLAKTILKWCA